MAPTKEDYEENSRLVTWLWPAAKVLAHLLRPFARFGFTRRLVGGTIGGRIGAISRYEERGERDKAFDLAIKALNEYRHKRPGVRFPNGRDYWWFFMRLAARSLEECGDQEKWSTLEEMARNGVEPFEGYEAAGSFLAFSRRKYDEGDYDAAIENAETAARADETWAEPNFALGWYYLVLGRGDALEQFTQAIHKDHGILFRIANDSECRQHPHIIQRLKELSINGIVTIRDEPDTDDGNSD